MWEAERERESFNNVYPCRYGLDAGRNEGAQSHHTWSSGGGQFCQLLFQEFLAQLAESLKYWVFPIQPSSPFLPFLCACVEVCSHVKSMSDDTVRLGGFFSCCFGFSCCCCWFFFVCVLWENVCSHVKNMCILDDAVKLMHIVKTMSKENLFLGYYLSLLLNVLLKLCAPNSCWKNRR